MQEPATNEAQDYYEKSINWMTQSLRSTNTISSTAEVIGVEPNILTGGLMSNTLMLNLKYNGGSDGTPHSIVGKFPSSNDASRAAGKEMMVYEREVKFYQ